MKLTQSKRKNIYLWNIRESKEVRNKLPVITHSPTINYDFLYWLCNTPGLGSGDGSASEKETHEMFMQNYKKMFVSKPAKNAAQEQMCCPRNKLLKERKCPQCFHCESKNFSLQETECYKTDLVLIKKAEKDSSSIKSYRSVMHKERKSDDPDFVNIRNLQTLRHILRKQPFERTTADNNKILSILQTVSLFCDHTDTNVLRNLCAVATLEVWNEIHISVYGKTGIHLILKGSVAPLFNPYLVVGVSNDYPQAFVSLGDSEIDKTSSHKLSPGDCFGTWLQYEEPFTKELSVVTTEPKCEFLKISSSDYHRVITQMKQKEHAEKINLLLSCTQYKSWPRQPLTALADSIEWITYPPNTVLMNEGIQAPFIGFIKSGECHVMRQIDVFINGKNGKKEMQTKQVVVGRLGTFDTFAELSVLLDERIMCTIVTATDTKIGAIKPNKLKGLDEVTRQLIIQSNTRTFGHLTKEDIHNVYLEQELTRKWNKFKHDRVLEVIRANGIQPGHGKWAK